MFMQRWTCYKSLSLKKGKKEKIGGNERETCNTCPPMRGHICLLLSDGQNTVCRQFL